MRYLLMQSIAKLFHSEIQCSHQDTGYVVASKKQRVMNQCNTNWPGEELRIFTLANTKLRPTASSL